MTTNNYQVFFMLCSRASVKIQDLKLPEGARSFLNNLEDSDPILTCLQTSEATRKDVELVASMIRTRLQVEAKPTEKVPAEAPTAAPATFTPKPKPPVRKPDLLPTGKSVVAESSPPQAESKPVPPKVEEKPKQTDKPAPAESKPTPPPAKADAKPAPAAAQPASSGGEGKTGLWQTMTQNTWWTVIGIIALIIVATLLDTFYKPGANAVGEALKATDGFKFNTDWAIYSSAWANFVASFNVPWVRTITSITFVIFIFASLDTISNFTGADTAAIGGFFTILVAAAWMTNNQPLAVGLVAMGSALMRRDRDEGKSVLYYGIGLVAVLMVINFFGRDWESWSTENLGKSLLRTIVGGYFEFTTFAGPWIAWVILGLFYWSYLQDLDMDATMKTSLLTIISWMMMMGSTPFNNTVSVMLFPGEASLRFYVALGLWILAIPLEAREMFARKVKAGKGMTDTLFTLIGILGITFGLAYVFTLAYPAMSITVAYGAMTMIITLLFGIVSTAKHNAGEAAWKPWVSEWESMVGDIVTDKRVPWFFYMTMFNIGWLILGLMVLLGKLP